MQFSAGVALWSIGSANTKLGVVKRFAGNLITLLALGPSRHESAGEEER
jgi:hypothetical protein